MDYNPGLLFLLTWGFIETKILRESKKRREEKRGLEGKGEGSRRENWEGERRRWQGKKAENSLPMWLHMIQCCSLERLLSESFCLSFTPKWNQVWLILAMTSPIPRTGSLCSSYNQNNPAPNTDPWMSLLTAKSGIVPGQLIRLKFYVRSYPCSASPQGEAGARMTKNFPEHQGEVQLLKIVPWYPGKYILRSEKPHLALPTLRSPTCLPRELPAEAPQVSCLYGTRTLSPTLHITFHLASKEALSARISKTWITSSSELTCLNGNR